MAGPHDPAAAGRDGLRAGRVDRGQVIEALKAAFVQGMLAKNEFDARMGQALASRTYADLAALTADIPPGPPAAGPARPPAPARRRPLARAAAGPGLRLVAAAAVAAIAVLAAVLALSSPRAHQTGLGSASAFDPKFMIVISSAYSLQVRDFRTGAVVHRILIPAVPDFCHHSACGRHFTWVTTSNGRTYLAGISRDTPCRSWLYTFTLDSNGKASPLTPFAALPTLAEADITNLAISRNGRYLAFSAGGSGGCQLRQPGHVGVTNLVTGRTRQWSIPRTAEVASVSIDANGGLLLYGVRDRTPELRVIPTSAPPGPAADRSRAIISAARFGRSARFGPSWFSFAAISPDARTVYFSVIPAGPGPGAIWVVSLIGHHARKLASGQADGFITADPSVSHLLLFINDKPVKLDLTTGHAAALPFFSHDIFVRFAW